MSLPFSFSPAFTAIPGAAERRPEHGLNRRATVALAVAKARRPVEGSNP
jgi:hypothetical protein